VLKQGWIQLAESRVRNILGVRRYASLRQLEKKISEQGPAHKRPQPTYVFTGLKNLQQRGIVQHEAVGHNLPTFFMLRDFGDDDDLERRAYVLELYRKFQTYSDGPQALVEDKNMREWLNPSSEQVWSVIGNALRFPNAIPVIVCRKMNFLAFRVFQRIGLLCWQAYDQYFDPSIEEELGAIRHKDGLGFSDVTTDLTPSNALVRFFSSVIPENSPASLIQFESHRDLLRRYAIELRLDGSKDAQGKELHQARRTAIYNSFLTELRAQNSLATEETEEHEEPFERDE
jgi:hypothetical protein